MEKIISLLCIALAVSVVSLTVTKAGFFKKFRAYIDEMKSDFLTELFSCPFCFSFYVAFLFDAILHLKLLGCKMGFTVFHWNTFQVIADYMVSYLCIVGIAAIFSGTIYKLITAIK